VIDVLLKSSKTIPVTSLLQVGSKIIIKWGMKGDLSLTELVVTVTNVPDLVDSILRLDYNTRVVNEDSWKFEELPLILRELYELGWTCRDVEK